MKKNTAGPYFFEEHRKKTKNTALFIIAFLCFSLLLGAVSFLMLWRSYDYDFSNVVKTTAVSDESTQTTEQTSAPLEGKVSILFAHTSDDGSVIRSLSVISADLDLGSIKVTPLEASRKVSAPTGEISLADSFSASGMTGLSGAVALIDGCASDRYVKITDSALINIIKYFGDLQYVLAESVSHIDDELALELPAGEQLLSAETVLKFVKYNNLCYSEKDAANRNAVLLVAAINRYYTADIEGKSEEIYTALINSIQSDITIVDFHNSMSKLEAFAKSDSRGVAFVG